MIAMASKYGKKTRVFAMRYEESLYAPLEVSLKSIGLSLMKIGRVSVVDERRKVRVKAKRPNLFSMPCLS